jgi:hypothetical protein
LDSLINYSLQITPSITSTHYPLSPLDPI